MTDFRDKVCVVTGAGAGIGRALGLALAARGARLAISDIDPGTVAQTAGAAAARGAEVEHYALDVSDRDAVSDHAAAVAERFGAVDLLINNAGVAAEGAVGEIDIEDFEWVMAVNFWGVVYGCRAFLPQLIESGDGHIVNISSILGIIAVPDLAAYSASKFAVRGFSEALAGELMAAGAPVRLSCVHPGGIKTDIARSARSPGRTPDELAAEFELVAHMQPERAAEIILRGVARGRRRIFVGADAQALALTERLLGARYQRLLAWVTARASS